MSTKERQISTGREPCAVCHDDVAIHAVGQCDHSICYKCSTRMRVLCDQQYCAICRTDLPKVLFVKDYKKYRDINTQSFHIYRKHKIWFENDEVQNAFYDLISHKCKFCSGTKPFRTFHQLEQHMRREHGLHYCDICLAHLKVFSIERKCYDRERLARHRRLGDEDDKSFKGHPLCELCDQRFLDRDELARHCRKEHFRCHFCETDGKILEFFGDYRLLKEHFRHEHFLCEEGECASVQFTNAFRSDIDLKAHKAHQHTRGLKKAEARQARTLELDIQLAPRSGHGRGRPAKYDRERGAQGNNDSEVDGRQQEHWERKRSYARQKREEVEAAHAIAASLNHISRHSGAVAVVDPALINQVTVDTAQQQQDQKQFEKRRDDFPTLGTSRSNDEDEVDGSLHRNASSDTLAKKVALANNFSVQDGSMEDGDFPTLAGGGKVRAVSAKTKVWTTTPSDADFPSLSSPKSNRHANNISAVKTGKSWVKTASQPPPKPMPQTASASPKTRPKSQTVTPSSSKPAPGPSWNQHNVKSSSQAFTRAEDYPSLSSIGNSLIPATSQQPPPKLSMFKSSQSAAAAEADRSVSNVPPKRTEAAPVKFEKKDFPTLGQAKSTPAPQGQWLSKKQKEMEAPKENKQKKKTVKNEMKVLSKESDPALKAPPTEVKIEWEVPKPKPIQTSTVIEAQGKELEKLVSQQTKKKKNKKGKKCPDSGGSISADVSDKEYVRDDPKPEEVKINIVANVEREEAEKQALQPKMDNFPSLSELSEFIPAVVPTVDPPQFSKDDFPSLDSMGKKAPPPGFASVNSTARPPPGFVGTKSSVTTSNRAPPGFTCSQKENIENVAPAVTNGNSKEYSYVSPVNSKERNRKLIQDVQNLLSSEQFDEFKSYSGQFRQSLINGTEYYGKCCEIMGPQSFEKIFPELLVLLPDIEKQQILLSAHNDSIERNKNIIKISKSSTRGWNSTSNFTSCPTCRQVVSRPDLNSHSSEHGLNSDFPTLGNIASTLGGWSKK